MKTILAATAALLLPCGLASAQDSGPQPAQSAQPKVTWSYGGMADSPTKGYWKQPKVTWAYGFDKDDPTPGSNGPAPKVKFLYGDGGSMAPTWKGNPAPAPTTT